MTEFGVARAHMIESQLRPNKVIDGRVLGAFAEIRRELFVPEHLGVVAYIDEDLPLGGGRYLMEPMVVARLLQAAAIERTDTVLIIGASTGYEAALAGMLARSVVALEEDPELARRGRAALVEHSIASVSVVEGPLPQGYRPRAPYDVILFGGAVAEVPSEIDSQLAEGGRLLVVVKSANGIGRVTLRTRTGGVMARRVLFDAAAPLLPGFLPKPAFVF
jgi:protein-L-isoaspartate(D-aspartate) O-methyltransferase